MGFTILHLAVYEKRLEFVEMILSSVAPSERDTLLQQKDIYGNLPIHLAAVLDNEPILKLLNEKRDLSKSTNLVLLF